MVGDRAGILHLIQTAPPWIMKTGAIQKLIELYREWGGASAVTQMVCLGVPVKKSPWGPPEW